MTNISVSANIYEKTIISGRITAKTQVIGQVYATGARGEKGDKGDPSDTYIYEQSVPSDTWTIEHNMGKYPSVFVVDSANSVCIGNIQYINENSLVVTFIGGFSGKAYLN